MLQLNSIYLDRIPKDLFYTLKKGAVSRMLLHQVPYIKFLHQIHNASVLGLYFANGDLQPESMREQNQNQHPNSHVLQ